MGNPRNILLTGATSGIGLALADKLSRRHRVLGTARGLSPQLEKLMADGPDLRFCAVDQAQPEESVAAIHGALENSEWDGLDNVILNAGTGRVVAPEAETPQAINETLAVNLHTPLLLAQALLPTLEARRGKLTFVGSTARRGHGDFASYAASKAGLHGLARALREEWRGRVEVQVLHPGPTATPMHDKAGLPDTPLRRLFIDPAAMAAMIENTIASRKPAATLSFLQDWSGASLMGRGLR